MPIYRTGTSVYTPQQIGVGPTGDNVANTAGLIASAGGRFGSAPEIRAAPKFTGSLSFTEPSAPASPVPITNLVAAAGPPTSVDLTWTPGANATSQRVERRRTA